MFARTAFAQVYFFDENRWGDPLLKACSRAELSDYSYRNASIGSNAAALRAG